MKVIRPPNPQFPCSAVYIFCSARFATGPQAAAQAESPRAPQDYESLRDHRVEPTTTLMQVENSP